MNPFPFDWFADRLLDHIELPPTTTVYRPGVPGVARRKQARKAARAARRRNR